MTLYSGAPPARSDIGRNRSHVGDRPKHGAARQEPARDSQVSGRRSATGGGNVGIGTSSPSGLLDVYNGSGTHVITSPPSLTALAQNPTLKLVASIKDPAINEQSSGDGGQTGSG